MATITDTTTDANGNIIINVSSSADDAITLATAGTYSDKNIIFNIKTPQNSVQPDWNQNDATQPDYVKNRPFYTGDTTETVLVEERTIAFEDNHGIYISEFPSTVEVTAGETYKVSWDGTIYECTCVNYNDLLVIGNLSIVGEGADSGEPFIMVAVNGRGITVGTADTASSHTISISGRTTQIVKIDPKYLFQPDWNQNDETAPDYVKNRPFYTGYTEEKTLIKESTVMFKANGDRYRGSLRSTFTPIVGETYKVSWDGTAYESVCLNAQGGIGIGNLSIVGVGSNTGEPFLIEVGNQIYIYTLDTASSHVISISGRTTQVVKIDEKYLPDTVATKSYVDVVESTANNAQSTANNAQSTANSALSTANAAKTAADNAKIDPVSYNYCASLFSKKGEFVGWYETIPILGYNSTLGSFYRNSFETTPMKRDDIPFNSFICKAYLNLKGFPSGSYILFLTILNNASSGWSVSGVAIHESGDTFNAKSPVVNLSTGEGLFLELLPKYQVMIKSSTTGSTKKFRIKVDDDYNVSATNITDSVSKTLATTEYVDKSVSNPLNITGATVGQIAEITAVDDTGKPTAWEAADMPDMPISFKPANKSYLTFSSPNSFTLAVNNATKNWDGTLEYFASDRTWTTWSGRNALSAVYDDGEYVLYLRGTGNTVISGWVTKYWSFTGSNIACIGNIETLLDYAMVESGEHPTMASNCYSSMFKDCTSLTQAPALPATTLASGCYSSMFAGCTSLTQVPALPATTLATSCYSGMFTDCTSLTQAPALPSTTLANYCYSSMFRGCTSLTQVPALPATTLATYCYSGMFADCTSLTQVPALPVTTLASYCYSNMFAGCTSLTQAPALPSTTLANYCYSGMFKGCTSLTQVPALPATTLAECCYYYMFEGCTSLKLSSTKTDEYTQEYRIPSSGDGTTASTALAAMFESTGGTFTGDPSINTTYYLSTDNMIVRETEIATLNGYVDSMIDAAVPKLDTTLSITGKSADAKATGDAIRALSDEIANLNTNGISATARNLLITILRNGVYISDQNVNITDLETALGGSDVPVIKSYAITNTLTNCTTNNAVTSVTDGGSYTATLTAADGYELDSVTVTMGGIDITSTAYSGSVITIASVTGDVSIVATAVAAESGGGETVVNLFDKSTMVVSGAFVGANGAISTSSTSKYAKIPISVGTYALQKGSGWAMNTTGHPSLIDSAGNVLCKFGNLQADGKAGSSSDASIGTIAKANGNAGIAVTVLSEAVTHIIFSICVNGGTDDTDTTMMEVGDTCHDYVAHV